MRGTFDVVIPYSASIAAAQDAIAAALRAHGGLQPDPPPRALVEALEPDGVRLRADFWFPAKGVDGFQLFSDARLRAKVALQEAGITPPPTDLSVTVVGRVPVDLGCDRAVPATAKAAQSGPATPDRARANLRQDAATAAAARPEGRDRVIEHVLNTAGDEVSDEGANLIGDGDGQR